jgi:steroid delta-isomerase-like uncharacterized protein
MIVAAVSVPPPAAPDAPAFGFVAAFTAAWNAHDPDGLAALAAPDFEGTDVAGAGALTGADGFRRYAAAYLRAFPDLVFTPDEVLADGDRMAVRWTAEGTHRGEFLHIPPTGRAIAVCGVTFLTLDGGRVRRSESVWDVAGLLRALGLLPELPVDEG